MRIPNLDAFGGTPRVLIVSPDEELNRALCQEVEKTDSVGITVARNGHDAIALLREQLPAVVICDVALPDMDGFRLCKLMKLPLRQGSDQVPVILVSGLYRDVLAEHVARKAKAFAFLKLPTDLQIVGRTIELALNRILPGRHERQLLHHKGWLQIACTDDTLAHAISTAVELDGWKVERAQSLAELVPGWATFVPQVVMFGLPSRGHFKLPEMNLRQHEEPPTLVAILPRPEPDRVPELLELGIDDILVLPCEPARYIECVRDARLKYNFRSMHGQFEEHFDKLKSISDYLDTVITNSHEAIFTCDPVGNVRLWNKGAERVYGYTAEEIVGKNVDDHLDPPGFTRKAQNVVRLLQQRGSMTDPEVERRRKSGEVFPVSATYTLLTDTHGEILGFSVIERDVTPIKALENERIKSARLRAITQTAVTANDHINTPLGIILGYAQFLEMKLATIDQQDRAALDIIQQQVHKIKGIMNKLKLISDPIVKNYSIEGVTMLDLSKSQLSNEAAN